MKKKTYFTIIIAFSAIICIGAIAIRYFLFTPTGLKALLGTAISRYAKSENVDIKNIKGTLIDGISLEGVSVRDLRYLPDGGLVKAKNIEVDFFNPAGFILRVKGGECILPNADQLFFHGDYTGSALDFNIYSKIIDTEVLRQFFKEAKFLS